MVYIWRGSILWDCAGFSVPNSGTWKGHNTQQRIVYSTPAAKASTGWLHFRNWQNLHLVWSDKRISGFLWWQPLWYWSWRRWLGLILHKLLSIFGCKWSKPSLDFACLFVFFTVYYNVFAKPKTDPWLTMPSSKYSYPKYINTIFRGVYC